MKAIGIEIDSSKVIFYAIEQDANNMIIDITGKFKSITIKDDYDNSEIKEFKSTIHSFFDNINPDRIAILKRMTKGRFSAAPVSFKLEGLIQCYEKEEIEFISPQTLTAFYKKNQPTIVCENKYQINAAKVAEFLIS